MGDPTLAGCDLKFARAQKHGERLNRLAERFLENHPIVVTPEIDRETGEKVFRVTEQPAKPPEWWSPIFGEFLYNLRSTLDHLAWQLVRLNGNEPSGTTEFPIFKDCTLYKSKRAQKLAGMHPDVVAIIDGLQPCARAKRPEADQLWWLQDFGNTDKHRVLHLIVRHSQGGVYVPPLRGMPSDKRYHPYIGGIDFNTELLRLPPEDVDVQYFPLFRISLEGVESPPRRDLAYLLSVLPSEVAGIVGRFRPLF